MSVNFTPSRPCPACGKTAGHAINALIVIQLDAATETVNTVDQIHFVKFAIKLQKK